MIRAIGQVKKDTAVFFPRIGSYGAFAAGIAGKYRPAAGHNGQYYFSLQYIEYDGGQAEAGSYQDVSLNVRLLQSVDILNENSAGYDRLVNSVLNRFIKDDARHNAYQSYYINNYAADEKSGRARRPVLSEAGRSVKAAERLKTLAVFSSLNGAGALRTAVAGKAGPENGTAEGISEKENAAGNSAPALNKDGDAEKFAVKAGEIKNASTTKTAETERTGDAAYREHTAAKKSATPDRERAFDNARPVIEKEAAKIGAANGETAVSGGARAEKAQKESSALAARTAPADGVNTAEKAVTDYDNDRAAQGAALNNTLTRAAARAESAALAYPGATAERGAGVFQTGDYGYARLDYKDEAPESTAPVTALEEKAVLLGLLNRATGALLGNPYSALNGAATAKAEARKGQAAKNGAESMSRTDGAKHNKAYSGAVLPGSASRASSGEKDAEEAAEYALTRTGHAQSDSAQSGAAAKASDGRREYIPVSDGIQKRYKAAQNGGSAVSGKSVYGMAALLSDGNMIAGKPARSLLFKKSGHLPATLSDAKARPHFAPGLTIDAERDAFYSGMRGGAELYYEQSPFSQYGDNSIATYSALNSLLGAIANLSRYTFTSSKAFGNNTAREKTFNAGRGAEKAAGIQANRTARGGNASAPANEKGNDYTRSKTRGAAGNSTQARQDIYSDDAAAGLANASNYGNAEARTRGTVKDAFAEQGNNAKTYARAYLNGGARVARAYGKADSALAKGVFDRLPVGALNGVGIFTAGRALGNAPGAEYLQALLEQAGRLSLPQSGDGIAVLDKSMGGWTHIKQNENAAQPLKEQLYFSETEATPQPVNFEAALGKAERGLEQLAARGLTLNGKPADAAGRKPERFIRTAENESAKKQSSSAADKSLSVQPDKMGKAAETIKTGQAAEKEGLALSRVKTPAVRQLKTITSGAAGDIQPPTLLSAFIPAAEAIQLAEKSVMQQEPVFRPAATDYYIPRDAQPAASAAQSAAVKAEQAAKKAEELKADAEASKKEFEKNISDMPEWARSFLTDTYSDAPQPSAAAESTEAASGLMQTEDVIEAIKNGANVIPVEIGSQKMEAYVRTLPEGQREEFTGMLSRISGRMAQELSGGVLQGMSVNPVMTSETGALGQKTYEKATASEGYRALRDVYGGMPQTPASMEYRTYAGKEAPQRRNFTRVDTDVKLEQPERGAALTDAEINKMVNKIYSKLEQRLKTEKRRFGL